MNMIDYPLLAQSSEHGGGGAIQMIFGLLIFFLLIASMWKLYEKAGQPGWAAIIPIYNFIIYLKIINKPVWMILLLLIPIVNVVLMLYWSYLFIKAYGGGIGLFIASIFFSFIVYPYLAFGDAKYQGAE